MRGASRDHAPALARGRGRPRQALVGALTLSPAALSLLRLVAFEWTAEAKQPGRVQIQTDATRRDA